MKNQLNLDRAALQRLFRRPTAAAADFLARRFTPVAALLLILGLALHLSLLASLPYGFLDDFFVYSHENRNPDGSRQTVDFSNYYKAGYCLGHGLDYYDDSLDLTALAPHWQASPIRYAPSCAVMLLPLQLLPFRQAYIAWIILAELLFIGSILLITSLTASNRRKLLVVILYLFFTVHYVEYYDGQMNFLIGFLIAVMLYGLVRQHNWAFLAAWLLATALKHFTAILLPLFLFRRQLNWYAFGVAIVGLSLPVYAIAGGHDFPDAFTLNFQLGAGETSFSNLSLYSFTNNLFGSLQLGSFRIGTLAYLLINIALLARLVPAVIRRRDDHPYLLMLLLSYFFILYHRIWAHHLLLLLPVFAYAIITAPRRSTVLYLLGLAMICGLPLVFWMVPYLDVSANGYLFRILHIGQRQIPLMLFCLYLLHRADIVSPAQRPAAAQVT